jgi:DNA recombination protein RmuC
MFSLENQVALIVISLGINVVALITTIIVMLKQDGHKASLNKATEDLVHLNKLDVLYERLGNLQQENARLFALASDQHTRQMTDLSSGLTNILNQQLQSISLVQKQQLDSFSKQLMQLTTMNEGKLETIRTTVEQRLTRIQAENSEKLEQMRATVEEKLHDTLEKRLNQSFSLVSERLELVHTGLGEMKSLATGVGDLKRVLSNVKTRGMWGEIQLDLLLEQILNSSQYEKNVAVIPNSTNRVEYAIKLPTKEECNPSVWLPIDSKFPLEDYQRLVAAQEIADVIAIKESIKAIEVSIKKAAKMIADKYLLPPHTTDFAIMFIPIEGLYAEVLRIPGLCEALQQQYRVTIASPSTFCAMLNSLQIVLRTLAIERRSTEVWRLLGDIKTEFFKFGDLLKKTKEKLEQAGKAIGDAHHRSEMIQKKLSNIEVLPNASNDQIAASSPTLEVEKESAGA